MNQKAIKIGKVGDDPNEVSKNLKHLGLICCEKYTFKSNTKYIYKDEEETLHSVISDGLKRDKEDNLYLVIHKPTPEEMAEDLKKTMIVDPERGLQLVESAFTGKSLLSKESEEFLRGLFDRK